MRRKINHWHTCIPVQHELRWKKIRSSSSIASREKRIGVSDILSMPRAAYKYANLLFCWLWSADFIFLLARFIVCFSNYFFFRSFILIFQWETVTCIECRMRIFKQRECYTFMAVRSQRLCEWKLCTHVSEKWIHKKRILILELSKNKWEESNTLTQKYLHAPAVAASNTTNHDGKKSVYITLCTCFKWC